MRALIDTNILVDYLNAVPSAKTELGAHKKKSISVITWIEVMIGVTPETEAGTRGFLDGFELLELDQGVCERAVELRQNHKIKLPDAIVWATAQVHNLLLVTRNTRDFSEKTPGIRVPYRL